MAEKWDDYKGAIKDHWSSVLPIIFTIALGLDRVFLNHNAESKFVNILDICLSWGVLASLMIFLINNIRSIHNKVDSTFKVKARVTDSETVDDREGHNLFKLISIYNDRKDINARNFNLLQRRLEGLLKKIQQSDIAPKDVRKATRHLDKCSKFTATSTRSIEWLFEPTMIKWMVHQIAQCWKQKYELYNKKQYTQLSEIEKLETGYVRYFIYDEKTFVDYNDDLKALKESYNLGYIRTVGLERECFQKCLVKLKNKHIKYVQEAIREDVENIINGQFSPLCYPDFIVFYDEKDYLLGVAYREDDGQVSIRNMQSDDDYPIKGAGSVTESTIVQAFDTIASIIVDAENSISIEDCLADP